MQWKKIFSDLLGIFCKLRDLLIVPFIASQLRVILRVEPLNEAQHYGFSEMTVHLSHAPPLAHPLSMSLQNPHKKSRNSQSFVRSR